MNSTVQELLKLQPLGVCLLQVNLQHAVNWRAAAHVPGAQGALAATANILLKNILLKTTAAVAHLVALCE
jgi:hypothetical protein